MLKEGNVNDRVFLKLAKFVLVLKCYYLFLEVAARFGQQSNLEKIL